MNGGYDEGYRGCACFWGTEPGSYVRMLKSHMPEFSGSRVLDVGCGEGKNAMYFARHGATVDAIDVSEYAIGNGQRHWTDVPGIRWRIGDARTVELPDHYYDVVVAYGLLHCLAGTAEVTSVLGRLKRCVRHHGYIIICAFNDRQQDLSAHPGFLPCLLSHAEYLELIADFEIVAAADSDLTERHPHNQIEHTHSLTRILARKLY